MCEREGARNRLLRRADWRFLLSCPSPHISVCFGGGSLRDAVTRISGSVVQPSAAREDSCDLAVANDPSAHILSEAVTRLRRGGACYVEYRGRFVTAWSVRRKMTHAGLDPVSAYWPWPSPDRCQAWIPLDNRTVARAYFQMQRELIPGRLRRFVRRAADAAAVIRQRLAGTYTVSGIGTKPDAQAPSPVAVDGRGVSGLLHRQSALDTTGIARRRLYPLVQTTGPRSVSKVVVLAFFDDDKRPAAVVKFARVPEAAVAMAREADTLDRLHTLHDLPSGIPRVLFRHTGRDVFAVAESSLGGASIAHVVRPQSYRLVAEAATEWLGHFALASATASGGWATVTTTALHDFADAYGRAIDTALLTAIRRRFMTAPVMPSVCEHRDFSPWNVFISRGRSLTVFDWESSVLRGVPALDLIYFLSYLSAYSNRVPFNVESYRSAWNPSSATGRVNSDCIERYVRRLGLDPSWCGSLRLLAWLIHAQSEYERHVADTGGPPSAERLQRGVFLRLVEEEMRRGPSG